MFGLFKYTYDYYEWQELDCVSDKEEKLIERYNTMHSGKHKLVHAESSERDHLRDCETPYYTIEPVDVV
jgi:hypothetical protein